MTHCQETRVLSAVRILTRLRCYYYQDLHWKPVHRTSRPCFCPATTPTYRTLSTESGPEYRQQALAPSIFGALKLGR